MIDITRIIEKIVPEQDGPGALYRRKMTVAAINGDNTVNLTDGSGATIANVPVLGGAQLIVGSKVQVLTERGAMLVLGKVGAPVSPPTTWPNVLANFGTPSTTSGVVLTLTPTSIAYDPNPMYPGSGTLFTVPTGQGGLYTIGCMIRFPSQASPQGVRQMRVFRNGSELCVFQDAGTSPLVNISIPVSGATRLMMDAGDTVEFRAYQTSGATQALLGPNSVGWVHRIG